MSEGDEKENVEDFIRFKGFFFSLPSGFDLRRVVDVSGLKLLSDELPLSLLFGDALLTLMCVWGWGG